MTKSTLRQPLLLQRKTLTADDKSTMDSRIGTQLLQWWEAHQPESIGVYWPIRGEPDLQATFSIMHEHGARLALPVVVSNDAPLKFVEWIPGEAMTTDTFGVQVPATSREEIFPRALVIPCVGFNPQRFRLGYGGGFYDRTVARVPRPHMIGVAYAFSEVDFDADHYDVAMDELITEHGRFAD